MTSEKYLVSQEKMREGLRTFMEYLTGGKAEEALSIIGNVTTIGRMHNMVVDIDNWHMSQKIKRFIRQMQLNGASEVQFKKLSKRYGKGKILSNIILSLGSMRSEKQAEAFSHLLSALMVGDLDWNRFSELQNILEKIDPSALDIDFNNKEPSYRLVTVGLAYTQTVLNGVRVIPNGELYADFKRYIVNPYRNNE